MATGSVRLGAVDMPGLIDALEAGDSVFLIELGALREVSCPFKIPDLEEIAAAFGTT